MESWRKPLIPVSAISAKGIFNVVHLQYYPRLCLVRRNKTDMFWDFEQKSIYGSCEMSLELTPQLGSTLKTCFLTFARETGNIRDLKSDRWGDAITDHHLHFDYI